MPPKILVIDDEVDVLKVVKFRLEKAGYEVITALDGIKGLELALNERPSLIILDIMMPGGDGYTVCDKLKHSSATAAMPVIILSAKTESRDVIKGYATGAISYLKKPYDPEVLLATVKEAIEAPQELERKARGKIKKLLVLTKDPILKRTIIDNFFDIIELSFIHDIKEFKTLENAAELDIVLFDLMNKEIDFLEFIQKYESMLKTDALIILVTDFSTQGTAEKIAAKITLRCEQLNRPFEIGSLELLLKEVLKK